MDESIRSIFNNVTHVPRCGLPGTFVVFDEVNAFPLLTGPDRCDVIMAGAQYGQGRVLAISHEIYIEKFLKQSHKLQPLWSNVKDWLTRGEINDEDQVVAIENLESVGDLVSGEKNYKIVAWNGTIGKSELFVNQLLKKYVFYGGSVLCGICPWGWLSLSRRSLDDMPINIFLSMIGICATARPCRFDTATSLIAVDPDIIFNRHYSHFGWAFSYLSNNIGHIPSTDKDLESILVNSISSLPTVVAIKLLDRIHKTLYAEIVLKYMPTSSVGVQCPRGRFLLSLCSRLYQKYSECGLRIKAPNIDEFPGDFVSSTKRVPQNTTAILSLKSRFDEFHSTGYYAPAGSAIKVYVLDGNPTGWEIRIGCHTDDISDTSCYNRWPVVSSSVKLRKSTSVSTAFGGLVYFESPKGSSSLKVRLESVVEAPFYDLTKPETVQNWSKSRMAPGLWAELCGKKVVFTVPSCSIRDIEDPKEILNVWDSIVAANHELRGTDSCNTWRERIVVDIQPHGNIHSGYPIVISYDFLNTNNGKYLFDVDSILSHGWSLLHELGHNFQRPTWTQTGTHEVMPNVYTLHALEHVYGDGSNWRNRLFNISRLKRLLKDFTFSYDHWSRDPNIAFLIYLQLVQSFGWPAFKLVFREYESSAKKVADSSKRVSDEIKWAEWIVKFSNVVGLNLSPLFYFWSIPFSNVQVEKLIDTTLPLWLPDDSITQLLPSRVSFVKESYSNLVIGSLD